MSDGVVQQVGTPMELYERPAKLFVANFLGTVNILEGRIQGQGTDRIFNIEDGISLPIPTGAAVPPDAKLVFRPQDAVPCLAPSLTGSSSAPRSVTGCGSAEPRSSWTRPFRRATICMSPATPSL